MREVASRPARPAANFLPELQPCRQFGRTGRASERKDRPRSSRGPPPLSRRQIWQCATSRHPLPRERAPRGLIPWLLTSWGRPRARRMLHRFPWPEDSLETRTRHSTYEALRALPPARPLLSLSLPLLYLRASSERRRGHHSPPAQSPGSCAEAGLPAGEQHCTIRDDARADAGRRDANISDRSRDARFRVFLGGLLCNGARRLRLARRLHSANCDPEDARWLRVRRGAENLAGTATLLVLVLSAISDGSLPGEIPRETRDRRSIGAADGRQSSQFR